MVSTRSSLSQSRAASQKARVKLKNNTEYSKRTPAKRCSGGNSGFNRSDKKEMVELNHDQDSVLRIPSKTISFSDLVKAHEALKPTSHPKELPCVWNNYEAIKSHLLQAIHCNRGDTIYVSGVPGTGKTLTVTSAIMDLKMNCNIPFEYIFINGMHCSESASVYSELWEKISNEIINPKKAVVKLGELFAKLPTLPGTLIVIIDELDVLITRNQEVIYNILDWSNLPNSNMIVVAIANTADLPERVLKNKISSRLGSSHVEFKAYHYKQLIEIALSRMKGIQVFDDIAIEYCSRKVASLSGDARKLLNLFRMAIELYEDSVLCKTLRPQIRLKKIGIEWIDAALKISYQSNTQRHLCSLSTYQKLFLIAYTKLHSRKPSTLLTLDALIHEYREISSLYPQLSFGAHSIPYLIASLIEKRVLITELRAPSDTRSTIVSNFPIQDILQALKSDPDRLITSLVSTHA